MNYSVHDMDLRDIPIRELGKPGDLIVCLDPSSSLSRKTKLWVVLMYSGNPFGGYTYCGLFWDREIAVTCAKALVQTGAREEGGIKGVKWNQTTG